MYNLENRVLSCTHDNSQNAIHACHTLKEDLDGQKVAPFCYIPCAARALNLIIDDGLRTTKPVISKIREFVLELNSSGEMAEDFIQITTAYQEGSWKLPLETSARWSGNYQMLDLVCKVLALSSDLSSLDMRELLPHTHTHTHINTSQMDVTSHAKLGIY